jgi:hypothetical protein
MNAATQLTILQAVIGVPVTITRGSESVPMTAIRGSTRGEMTGDNGTQTEYLTVDWLITIWQTMALGKPQRGDLITDQCNTYTVAHPDPTVRVVSPHGNDGTAWRVHSIDNGQ